MTHVPQIFGSATAGRHGLECLCTCLMSTLPFWAATMELGLDKLSERRHEKRNRRNGAKIEIMTLHRPVYCTTVHAIGE